MTAQKLLATLKLIETLDATLKLQETLTKIHQALNDLVSSPAQPTHQASLAAALKLFSESATRLDTLITPSQVSTIAELGGKEFFVSGMAADVQRSVSENAMTPAVARDFVAGLVSRRAHFLETVRGAIQGIEGLGIRADSLPPGGADVAFLVPRDLFKNHLHEFSKEVKFIDRIMADLTEAITGERRPVELEQLSSSIPTIALAGVGIIVLDKLATIVNKFLDAWKKLEEIRDIRYRLRKVGMTGGQTEAEITKQITTIINDVVEESTSIVMLSYTGTDEGRKNELKTAVRQDAKRLFGQIERGLALDFRSSPKGAANDENHTALENIANLASTMQFPTSSEEPFLLEAGQVLEGDISDMVVIKKQTHKTKKETQVKDAKPEA